MARSGKLHGPAGLGLGLFGVVLCACGAAPEPAEPEAVEPAAARAPAEPGCPVCGPVCAAPGPVAARDDGLDLRQLELAAGHGDANAEFRLGMRYLLGLGVEADDQQAGSWLRRAAEQGHADAQSELGAIHEFGRGVPRDDALAQAWYRLGAAQGHGTAKTRRDRLAVVMDPADLARAERHEQALRERIRSREAPAAGPAQPAR